MNLFKNKWELIIGGSRGIGAAIVKLLANEGAHIVLIYTISKDRANEIVKSAQAFGVQAIVIQ